MRAERSALKLVIRGEQHEDQTTVLALGAAETGQIQGSLLKAFVRIFHAASIRYYFKLSPGGEVESFKPSLVERLWPLSLIGIAICMMMRKVRKSSGEL